MNKYKGQLTLHSEMGCGVWAQFHDDRGLHGDKNQYWSWDWTINFNKDSIERIIIYDEQDRVLYDGPYTYSRIKLKEQYKKGNNYPICFPKEIDYDKWFNYCVRNLRMEIETKFTVDALMNQEEKKCSVDHEKYKSGVESCIKHGYYIDHTIQCPECHKYLESKREGCDV